MVEVNRTAVFGILVMGASLVAWTPLAAGETGLREACRQDLSSRYLSAFTDGQQSANEIAMLQHQITAGTPILQKASRDFQEAKVVAEREHFNQDKADALQVASDKLRALTQSLEETKGILASRKTLNVKALTETASLREQLSKVFVVQDVTLKGGAGQTVRLEYRSPCPRYRSTCPLPQQEAWDLESIIDQTPDSCRKYAKVRGPRATTPSPVPSPGSLGFTPAPL